jgi:hypothetical protein
MFDKNCIFIISTLAPLLQSIKPLDKDCGSLQLGRVSVGGEGVGGISYNTAKPTVWCTRHFKSNRVMWYVC